MHTYSFHPQSLTTNATLIPLCLIWYTRSQCYTATKYEYFDDDDDDIGWKKKTTG